MKFDLLKEDLVKIVFTKDAPDRFLFEKSAADLLHLS